MPMKSEKYRPSFWRILIITSVFVGSVTGVSACKPRPNEISLSFEIIEQKDWPGTTQFYELREPGLIIISSLEDMKNLNGMITEEAKAKLQVLDYSNYFALLVLQGLKPTTGYKANVDRIARYEGLVKIFAQFQEPKPDEKKADAVTSPYELIQVHKSGIWGQEVMFNLIVNETTVVSLSHFIP